MKCNEQWTSICEYVKRERSSSRKRNTARSDWRSGASDSLEEVIRRMVNPQALVASPVAAAETKANSVQSAAVVEKNAPVLPPLDDLAAKEKDSQLCDAIALKKNALESLSKAGITQGAANDSLLSDIKDLEKARADLRPVESRLEAAKALVTKLTSDRQMLEEQVKELRVKVESIDVQLAEAQSALVAAEQQAQIEALNKGVLPQSAAMLHTQLLPLVGQLALQQQNAPLIQLMQAFTMSMQAAAPCVAAVQDAQMVQTLQNSAAQAAPVTPSAAMIPSPVDFPTPPHAPFVASQGSSHAASQQSPVLSSWAAVEQAKVLLQGQQQADHSCILVDSDSDAEKTSDQMLGQQLFMAAAGTPVAD